MNRENNIPDILQKMAQVCPVKCYVFIYMDSDCSDEITLQWRWSIKKRPLRYSIKIHTLDIVLSRIDIIQKYIIPLKNANWQNPTDEDITGKDET